MIRPVAILTGRPCLRCGHRQAKAETAPFCSEECATLYRLAKRKERVQELTLAAAVYAENNRN